MIKFIITGICTIFLLNGCSTIKNLFGKRGIGDPNDSDYLNNIQTLKSAYRDGNILALDELIQIYEDPEQSLKARVAAGKTLAQTQHPNALTSIGKMVGTTTAVDYTLLSESINMLGMFDENPKAAESGRVLAHFHDLLRTHPKGPSMNRRTYHIGSRVFEVLDELKAILKVHENDAQLCGLDQPIEYLSNAYKQSYEAVEQVDFSSLPQCVVHGDWHPGNMLYKDDEIIAVIDFDSIRYSQRITDVAIGALQFSMRMGELE